MSTRQPTTKLTREGLYELIWSRSMQKVAAELGVTGTGLKKICARHKIPAPPLGYWAKLAAGKSVKKTALPSPPPDAPTEILITGSPPKRYSIDRSTLKDITVPQILRNPHPLIARWDVQHRARVAEARRNRWSTPDELPPHHKRMMRILQAVLRELERRGLTIEEHRIHAQTDTLKRGHFFVVDGDARVEVRMRQAQRQQRRHIAPEEIGWTSRGWRYEYVWTDHLVCELWGSFRSGDGIKSTWRETDKKTFESFLPEFVETIVLALTAIKEWHAESVERQRVWAIKNEERQAATALERVEEQRWAHFVDMATRYQQFRQIVEFATVLEQRLEPEREYGEHSGTEWLTWMKENTALLDPLNAGVERVLAKLGGPH